MSKRRIKISTLGDALLTMPPWYVSLILPHMRVRKVAALYLEICQRDIREIRENRTFTITLNSLRRQESLGSLQDAVTLELTTRNFDQISIGFLLRIYSALSREISDTIEYINLVDRRLKSAQQDKMWDSELRNKANNSF